MGLADIVRNAVAKADAITADLQPTIKHAAWTGNDGMGGSTYAAAISRAALIEQKQKKVVSTSGAELVSHHVITILRPITANGTAGRREPIDPRDLIQDSAGVTLGKIIAVESFEDRSTEKGYFYIVYLGAG